MRKKYKKINGWGNMAQNPPPPIKLRSILRQGLKCNTCIYLHACTKISIYSCTDFVLKLACANPANMQKYLIQPFKIRCIKILYCFKYVSMWVICSYLVNQIPFSSFRSRSTQIHVQYRILRHLCCLLQKKLFPGSCSCSLV